METPDELRDRFHAQQRNESTDALRSALEGRGASRAALPHRAWQRSGATRPADCAETTGLQTARPSAAVHGWPVRRARWLL
ncbi:hypothetical protein F6476_23215 [Pseudomonas umsongensis]|nr:hypothetical protein F6476_23215 [Pseudomonas umsongensis]